MFTEGLIYSEIIRQDEMILRDINDINWKLFGLMLFNMFCAGFSLFLMVGTIFIGFVVPVFCFLLALLVGMKGYKGMEIGKVDATVLFKHYWGEPKLKVLKELCAFFSESFEHNCNVHIQKNEYFRKSLKLWLLSTISLIATSIYFLIWCPHFQQFLNFMIETSM